MFEDQITAQLKASPWVTSFQLAKSLSLPNDRKIIRADIQDLKANGDIIQTGKAKGTRYALAGTPFPDGSEVKSNPPASKSAKPASDQTLSPERLGSILKAIAAAGVSGTTSKAIALLIDSDAPQARLYLDRLIQSSKIVTRGKVRWTRYYHVDFAPAEKITTASSTPSGKATKQNNTPASNTKLKAPPRMRKKRGAKKSYARPESTRIAEQKVLEIEIEIDDTPKLTVEEAVERVIGGMRPGREKTTQWICSEAAQKFGVNSLRASDYLIELVRSNSPLLYADFRNEEGLRLMVWVPRKGEIRPVRKRAGQQQTIDF